MFDFKTHKAEMLAHLTRMARLPGWKAHAWFRANDMAREYPEGYGDMPGLLMQEMNPPSASNSPSVPSVSPMLESTGRQEPSEQKRTETPRAGSSAPKRSRRSPAL